MSEEIKIFKDYICQKGLKDSHTRLSVLKAFLETEEHLSPSELHEIVKRNNPGIGQATVYRTLKLITECGLAEEVDFNDGTKRFESKLGREHHGHLICNTCGHNLEMFSGTIKNLVADLSNETNFSVEHVRIEMFGKCHQCN